MGNMEGQNPPTMADTIECESDLISMKEHEIAALKAEVERWIEAGCPAHWKGGGR
jgi:hypothetical protein